MYPKRQLTLIECLFDYAQGLTHHPRWMRDPSRAERKAFLVNIREGGTVTDLVVEVSSVLKLEARWLPLDECSETFREFAIAWYCAKSRENALVHYGYERSKQFITIAHRSKSKIDVSARQHPNLWLYE